MLEPNADEEVPLAMVPKPNATERFPTLASFHSVPLTTPALNAPFLGLKNIRAPGPEAVMISPIANNPVTNNPSRPSIVTAPSVAVMVFPFPTPPKS